MVLRAFDLGVNHYDLANNYGDPPGSAEEALGRLLRTDLAAHRDELIISTKAGWTMWPGPYGDWGSRKYLLASLDQSLRRLGLDYVDIFYSHRLDPATPLEETMGALDQAVRQGKALYAGISSYPAAETRQAAALLKRLGTPCLIHQPSYSLLNRWVEDGLLDVLDEAGIGCIAFSVLAQGALTGKYLRGVSGGSRAANPASPFRREFLRPEVQAKVAGLGEIAAARGQTPRAAGARLGPARSPHHQRAGRGEPGRADRRGRRRARQPQLQRGRARPDRPRAGVGAQPGQ